MKKFLICLLVTFFIGQLSAKESYPLGSNVSANGYRHCIIPIIYSGKPSCGDPKRQRQRCALAIRDEALTKAGSFFGMGIQNEYKFMMSSGLMGPLLMVRARSTNSDETTSSKFYSATSIYSTCDELKIEFELVDTTDESTIIFPEETTSKSQKITLRATVVTEGGEFSLSDLRGHISSNTVPKINENIVLLRALRYKYPEILGDQNCAKDINEMSKEECNLYFNKLKLKSSEDLNFKTCILATSGENEPEFKRLSDLKDSGGLSNQIVGTNNGITLCPYKN